MKDAIHRYMDTAGTGVLLVLGGALLVVYLTVLAPFWIIGRIARWILDTPLVD